jgi:hypothetical protein
MEVVRATIHLIQLTLRLSDLAMTDSISMPPSQTDHVFGVEEAFQIYERALTAHRQHHPSLTLAGFMASQFAADAIAHHQRSN